MYDPYSYPDPSQRDDRDDPARDLESLLWLAAGAAWAVVAIKVVNEARKLESRKKTLAISNRLLHQVFPNGLRP